MGFDPRDFFDDDNPWLIAGVYFVHLVALIALAYLVAAYLAVE